MKGTRRILLAVGLPTLILIAAGIRLYRSPWSASHLHVTPDAVEYAVGAQRLASLHSYDLVIEGISYPPRYPPWFSALILLPAYLLDPGELGIGIIPVLLCSLAGVLAAYRIGARIGGEWAGAAACVCLVSSGVYRPWSREIMTDVPAAALGLWALYVFLLLREGVGGRGAWISGAVLSAGAFLLRSEYAVLFLPFGLEALRSTEHRWSRVLVVTIPFVCALLATFYDHLRSFGDVFRSGYQFWTPVPCDYPGMMISVKNVGLNLANLFGPWALPDLILGAIGIAAILAKRSAPGFDAIRFLVLGALPVSCAHLLLPFIDARFHVLSLSILCILGGSGIALLIPEHFRSVAWIVPLVVAPLAIALPRAPDPVPTRRIAAEALARVLPDDAVVISAIDPVYLEAIVLRGTKRRVVPVDREVEYASKAVAWTRIAHPVPFPSGLGDQRSPGLIAGGARDVCAFTADENPERLAAWVRDGVPVYVDFSFRPRKVPTARLRELGIEIDTLPRESWIGVLRQTR